MSSHSTRCLLKANQSLPFVQAIIAQSFTHIPCCCWQHPLLAWLTLSPHQWHAAEHVTKNPSGVHTEWAHMSFTEIPSWLLVSSWFPKQQNLNWHHLQNLDCWLPDEKWQLQVPSPLKSCRTNGTSGKGPPPVKKQPYQSTKVFYGSTAIVTTLFR